MALGRGNVQINVGATGLTKSIVNQVQAAQSQIPTLNVKLNDKGFRQPLGRITGDLSEFQNSLDASVARTLAFGAAVGVINSLSNAFKAMISSSIEVEKKLADVNVILNLNTKALGNFSSQLFEVAKNTGQSFDEVSDAAVELARQGLGAEETIKRINDAMILTRLSGMAATKSVETLTAAINGFGSAALTTTDIINKLATVDAAFAVSTDDLSNALARAGSTAQAAKVSMDELLGAVTSVQQTTARGGAVIGNAFKSIFTRIQRSSVREQLESIGVATTDAAGNIRNAMSILKDYSSVYKTLGDGQKAYTDELIAGVFQINNLRALVKDLGSEFSIYDRAVMQAADATDEATRRNKELNKTMSALVVESVASLKELAATLGTVLTGPAVTNILNIFNSISKAFTTALDPEKGSKLVKGMFTTIGSWIAGPGLVLIGAAFLKLFKFITVQSIKAVGEVFKIGRAADKVKQTETQLTAILQTNKDLYAAIANTTLTHAQREKLVLDAINAENAALRQQEAMIARLAQSRGIGGALKGKAGGFIPSFAKDVQGAMASEREAILAGEGGASSGAQAKVLKGFPTGGGRRETFVANTDEVIIPKFGGGSGSAIFNKDMIQSMGGVPEGAVPVARGFIPNFQTGKKQTKGASGKGIGSQQENVASALRYAQLTGVNAAFDASAYGVLFGVGGSGGASGKVGGLNFVLGNSAGARGVLEPMFKDTITSSPKTVLGDYLQLGSNEVYKRDHPRGIKFPPTRNTQLELNRFNTAAVVPSTDDNYASAEAEFTNRIIQPAAESAVKKIAQVVFSSLLTDQTLGKKMEQSDVAGNIAKGAEGELFEVAMDWGSQVIGSQGPGRFEVSGDSATWDWGEEDSQRIAGVWNTLTGAKDIDAKRKDKGKHTWFQSHSSLASKIFQDPAASRMLGNELAAAAKTKSSIFKEKYKQSQEKRKASGFIPNFAGALEEAIVREKEALAVQGSGAGVYVGQDNRLQGGQNPMGLLVANSRDEPLAGSQGVNRAINGGMNPKTMGAAHGFIPSFAENGVQKVQVMGITQVAIVKSIPPPPPKGVVRTDPVGVTETRELPGTVQRTQEVGVVKTDDDFIQTKEVGGGGGGGGSTVVAGGGKGKGKGKGGMPKMGGFGASIVASLAVTGVTTALEEMTDISFGATRTVSGVAGALSQAGVYGKIAAGALMVGAIAWDVVSSSSEKTSKQLEKEIASREKELAIITQNIEKTDKFIDQVSKMNEAIDSGNMDAAGKFMTDMFETAEEMGGIDPTAMENLVGAIGDSEKFKKAAQDLQESVKAGVKVKEFGVDIASAAKAISESEDAIEKVDFSGLSRKLASTVKGDELATAADRIRDVRITADNAASTLQGLDAVFGQLDEETQKNITSNKEFAKTFAENLQAQLVYKAAIQRLKDQLEELNKPLASLGPNLSKLGKALTGLAADAKSALETLQETEKIEADVKSQELQAFRTVAPADMVAGKGAAAIANIIAKSAKDQENVLQEFAAKLVTDAATKEEGVVTTLEDTGIATAIIKELQSGDISNQSALRALTQATGEDKDATVEKLDAIRKEEAKALAIQRKQLEVQQRLYVAEAAATLKSESVSQSQLDALKKFGGGKGDFSDKRITEQFKWVDEMSAAIKSLEDIMPGGSNFQSELKERAGSNRTLTNLESQISSITDGGLDINANSLTDLAMQLKGFRGTEEFEVLTADQQNYLRDISTGVRDLIDAERRVGGGPAAVEQVESAGTFDLSTASINALASQISTPISDEVNKLLGLDPEMIKELREVDSDTKNIATTIINQEQKNRKIQADIEAGKKRIFEAMAAANRDLAASINSTNGPSGALERASEHLENAATALENKAGGFIPNFAPQSSVSKALNTERKMGAKRPVVDHHRSVGTYVRDNATQKNFSAVRRDHPEGLRSAVDNSARLQGVASGGLVPNFGLFTKAAVDYDAYLPSGEFGRFKPTYTPDKPYQGLYYQFPPNAGSGPEIAAKYTLAHWWSSSGAKGRATSTLGMEMGSPLYGDTLRRLGRVIPGELLMGKGQPYDLKVEKSGAEAWESGVKSWAHYFQRTAPKKYLQGGNLHNLAQPSAAHWMDYFNENWMAKWFRGAAKTGDGFPAWEMHRRLSSFTKHSPLAKGDPSAAPERAKDTDTYLSETSMNYVYLSNLWNKKLRDYGGGIPQNVVPTKTQLANVQNAQMVRQMGSGIIGSRADYTAFNDVPHETSLSNFAHMLTTSGAAGVPGDYSKASVEEKEANFLNNLLDQNPKLLKDAIYYGAWDDSIEEMSDYTRIGFPRGLEIDRYGEIVEQLEQAKRMHEGGPSESFGGSQGQLSRHPAAYSINELGKVADFARFNASKLLDEMEERKNTLTPAEGGFTVQTQIQTTPLGNLYKQFQAQELRAEKYKSIAELVKGGYGGTFINQGKSPGGDNSPFQVASTAYNVGFGGGKFLTEGEPNEGSKLAADLAHLAKRKTSGSDDEYDQNPEIPWGAPMGDTYAALIDGFQNIITSPPPGQDAASSQLASADIWAGINPFSRDLGEMGANLFPYRGGVGRDRPTSGFLADATSIMDKTLNMDRRRSQQAAQRRKDRARQDVPFEAHLLKESGVIDDFDEPDAIERDIVGGDLRGLLSDDMGIDRVKSSISDDIMAVDEFDIAQKKEMEKERKTEGTVARDMRYAALLGDNFDSHFAQATGEMGLNADGVFERQDTTQVGVMKRLQTINKLINGGQYSASIDYYGKALQGQLRLAKEQMGYRSTGESVKTRLALEIKQMETAIGVLANEKTALSMPRRALEGFYFHKRQAGAIKGKVSGEKDANGNFLWPTEIWRQGGSNPSSLQIPDPSGALGPMVFKALYERGSAVDAGWAPSDAGDDDAFGAFLAAYNLEMDDTGEIVKRPPPDNPYATVLQEHGGAAGYLKAEQFDKESPEEQQKQRWAAAARQFSANPKGDTFKRIYGRADGSRRKEMLAEMGMARTAADKEDILSPDYNHGDVRGSLKALEGSISHRPFEFLIEEVVHKNRLSHGFEAVNHLGEAMEGLGIPISRMRSHGIENDKLLSPFQGTLTGRPVTGGTWSARYLPDSDILELQKFILGVEMNSARGNAPGDKMAPKDWRPEGTLSGPLPGAIFRETFAELRQNPHYIFSDTYQKKDKSKGTPTQLVRDILETMGPDGWSPWSYGLAGNGPRAKTTLTNGSLADTSYGEIPYTAGKLQEKVAGWAAGAGETPTFPNGEPNTILPGAVNWIDLFKHLFGTQLVQGKNDTIEAMSKKKYPLWIGWDPDEPTMQEKFKNLVWEASKNTNQSFPPAPPKKSVYSYAMLGYRMGKGQEAPPSVSADKKAIDTLWGAYLSEPEPALPPEDDAGPTSTPTPPTRPPSVGWDASKWKASRGFIPNFAAITNEIAASRSAGYRKPVSGSQVKSMSIPGAGKTTYNTQESVFKAKGMTQPFIRPPADSRAAKGYAGAVGKKFGFNPYKDVAAQGFVPNLAPTDRVGGLQEAGQLFTQATESFARHNKEFGEAANMIKQSSEKLADATTATASLDLSAFSSAAETIQKGLSGLGEVLKKGVQINSAPIIESLNALRTTLTQSISIQMQLVIPTIDVNVGGASAITDHIQNFLTGALGGLITSSLQEREPEIIRMVGEKYGL